MKVNGQVKFRSPPQRVYEHIARTVFAHAVNDAPPDGALSRPMTLLTRYSTKRWYGTIVTTEEATLDPNRSITWKHVDGPLTGSVETFRIAPLNSGTIVTYEGEVSALNRFFTGPGNRLFVAPQTRAVSLASLEQARRDLDGD